MCYYELIDATAQGASYMDRPRKNDKTNVPMESLDAIHSRIIKCFAVLDKVARGVVLGHINAAIVSGAPGCGKTHSLERELNAAEAQGKIRYQSVKGSMSAIGLFRALFECSEQGSVLVIDDCDSVFGDLDAMNILKAALDTGKTRRVHWNKESRVLAEEGIPRSFEFKGAVLFITNIDLVREIAKQNKMAPHYEALLSRSLYVDMRIHTKTEVFVRVKQVVFDEDFLADNLLTKGQAQDMVQWLEQHLTKVRVLSIRTVIQMANFVKTDHNWKDMAEMLLLRDS
tara:strand:+ start:10732 stop:11586 length:855 start_codon:yes stop_codon:yes gene_type:complete